MNINLELYKIFYYVAKNESISRAANELLISQPAISKSIKTLEQQTNVPLFIRKRDGVKLTDAGEALYKKVKEAIELIYSAENDIQQLINLETGIINIGASKTILQEFLMPYIQEYHSLNPKIKIRIHTESTNELIKKAKAGIIDVLFLNMPITLPNELESFKIMNLHDILVANNATNQYKGKKFNKKDLELLPLLTLSKGTMVRKAFDDYCVNNNLNVKPIMEFGSNSLIKEFTLAGFGVGLLTEEHVKNELKEGKLYKLDLTFTLKEKYLGMVYLNDYKSISTQNFINYIKNSI